MAAEHEQNLVAYLGRSIDLRESSAEQLERALVLLEMSKAEQDNARSFRYAIMATHFVCAAAESILENYLDKKRNTDEGREIEDWFRTMVPNLDLLFSIRARDYHRDSVRFVDGFQMLGPILLRTNPGKNKTVIFRPTFPTSKQTVTTPKGGTAKTDHRGHEHLQFQGNAIMVDAEARRFMRLSDAVDAAATKLSGLTASEALKNKPSNP
jgi:hypothetical protein